MGKVIGERKMLNRHGSQKSKYRHDHPTCEVCGSVNHSRLTDVHHVIPVAAGGIGSQENLITLCPKHHRVAHLVGIFRAKTYFGPKDKVSLVKAICEFPEHRIPQEILQRDFTLARALR